MAKVSFFIFKLFIVMTGGCLMFLIVSAAFSSMFEAMNERTRFDSGADSMAASLYLKLKRFSAKSQIVRRAAFSLSPFTHEAKINARTVSEKIAFFMAME